MAEKGSENAGYGGDGVTAKEAYMVANAAMKLAEEHIKDCKEFRKDLRQSQERAHRERQTMHDANQSSINALKVQAGLDTIAMRAYISERTKGLYRLLWGMVLSTLAFCALVAWELIQDKLGM